MVAEVGSTRSTLSFEHGTLASFSKAISSASEGSRSEAPRSEGSQLSLGKSAFLSGNYNLSIFAERVFPQPRNSCSTAFSGKAENSGAALCRRLAKINCQVIQGLNSHSMFRESPELGAGGEGTRLGSVEWENILTLNWRPGPFSPRPQQLLWQDE